MCGQCAARVTIAQTDIRRFSFILAKRITRDGFIPDRHKATLGELKATLAREREQWKTCTL